jgi:hypothetical protein
MQNALNFDAMPDGPKKTKMKVKYEPVLRYLIEKLPALPERHPLHHSRDAIVAEITRGLETQYSPRN